MTCARFESLAADLARAGIPGPGLREPWALEAEEHAQNCRRCAARLAEERTLTAALRAVSQVARHASAPAHVEMTLLEAFRRSHEAEPAFHHGDDAGARSGGSRARWVAWAGLAAAAAFALVSVGLTWHWRAGREAPPATTTFASTTSPDAVKQASRDEPAARAVVAPGPVARGDTAAVRKPAPPEASRSTSSRSSSDHVPAADSAEAAFTVDAQWLSWTGAPEASGPVPVPTADIDTAPMVRVRVSRAALVVLGVLDAGTGDPAELLEADVIVGEEGLARAIRVVTADEPATRLAPPEV